MLKKIIVISIFVLFSGEVNAAGCFPSYTIYELNNTIYYTKFEGFFQTLLEGPIYNNKNIIILGTEKPCGEYSLEKYSNLTLFKLNIKDIIYIIINGLIIIFPFIVYIFLISKYIKKSIFLYSIGFIIFLLFNVYYFSLWY